MCHHTYLTLSEREDIMIMRREGRKITEIAVVKKVYDKINRRPRKRLGYRTPYEAHYGKSLHLI